MDEITRSALSRRTFLGGALAAGGLLLAGCGSDKAGGSSTNQPTQSISFAVANPQLPPFVAAYSSLPQNLGYWKDDGLDVKFATFNGGTATIQELVSNKVDVAMAAAASQFTAIAQGYKLKAYFTEANRNFWKIVTLDGSPIESISDLKGKTVGVSALTASVVPIMKATLAENGISDSDVTIVAIGRGAPEAAALQKGRVDAIGSFDGEVADIELQGVKLREIQNKSFEDVGFMQSLIADADLLTSKRDQLVKLARGIAKSIVFAKANPEAAVKIHWKVFPDTKPAGVSDAVAVKNGVAELQARLANVVEVDGQYGVSTDAQVQAYESLLLKAEVIDKSIAVSDAWSSSLLSDINNFDRGAIQDSAKNWKS